MALPLLLRVQLSFLLLLQLLLLLQRVCATWKFPAMPSLRRLSTLWRRFDHTFVLERIIAELVVLLILLLVLLLVLLLAVGGTFNTAQCEGEGGGGVVPEFFIVCTSLLLRQWR